MVAGSHLIGLLGHSQELEPTLASSLREVSRTTDTDNCPRLDAEQPSKGAKKKLQHSEEARNEENEEILCLIPSFKVCFVCARQILLHH